MEEGCEISTRFMRAEDRRTEIVEATQGRFSNMESRFDLATVDKVSKHLQPVIYVLENTSLRAM